MWVLPCGNSLFLLNLRYVQHWCRVKDPVTAFLDYIEVACVIIGCAAQAVLVTWLIDLMSLFFCSRVTNIPLVILVLAHRTCHVGLGAESVGASLAGNARAVCVPAAGSGWAIAFSSQGHLSLPSRLWFFHATRKNIVTLRPLPSLKTELKLASRFRSSKDKDLQVLEKRCFLINLCYDHGA